MLMDIVTYMRQLPYNPWRMETKDNVTIATPDYIIDISLGSSKETYTVCIKDRSTETSGLKWENLTEPQLEILLQDPRKLDLYDKLPVAYWGNKREELLYVVLGAIDGFGEIDSEHNTWSALAVKITDGVEEYLKTT